MDQAGKSQIDIINDLGVNKSSISTWVNGTRLPRMNTIELLADYLGVNPSDLIDGEIDSCSPSDIGCRIKVLRESKGMTLEALGHSVGVGKSTIRKWEAGIIRNMGQDKVVKLSSALGVSASYLMGVADAERPAVGFIYTSEENDLISRYREADDRIKFAVRKLLDMSGE